MSAVVSVNLDLGEFYVDDERKKPSQLRLVLTDTDGDMHRLVLEESALREIAQLIRGIQERFPGLLGGH